MKKILFLLLVFLTPVLMSAADYNTSLTFKDRTTFYVTSDDIVGVPLNVMGQGSTTSTLNGKSFSMGTWFRLSKVPNYSVNSNQFGGAVLMGYRGLNHMNSNGCMTIGYTRDRKLQLLGFGWGSGRMGITDLDINAYIPLEEWHFIAFAVDFAQKEVRIFLDEDLVGTKSFSGNQGTFDDTPEAYSFGGFGCMGAIDDSFIYNTALTAADVKKIVAGNPDQVDGLRGWYTFDEVKNGTTGQFENKATASDVVATYYSYTGTPQETGLTSGSVTEAAPNLTTITEETSRKPQVVEDPAEYIDGLWMATAKKLTAYDPAEVSDVEENLYFTAEYADGYVTMTSTKIDNLVIKLAYNSDDKKFTFERNELGQLGSSSKYSTVEPFEVDTEDPDEGILYKSLRASYSDATESFDEFERLAFMNFWYELSGTSYKWGISMRDYNTASYNDDGETTLAYIFTELKKIEEITPSISIGNISVVSVSEEDPAQVTITVTGVTGDAIEDAEITVSYKLNDGEYIEIDYVEEGDKYEVVIPHADLDNGEYTVSVKAVAKKESAEIASVEHEKVGTFTVENADDNGDGGDDNGDNGDGGDDNGDGGDDNGDDNGGDNGDDNGDDNNPGGSTGLNDVMDDDENVRYFNLNGMEVKNPSNGIYIRQQGSKYTKVLIR